MTASEMKYYALSEKLRKMKFAGMADELNRQGADPNADLRSFDERIEALINTEWEWIG